MPPLLARFGVLVGVGSSKVCSKGREEGSRSGTGMALSPFEEVRAVPPPVVFVALHCAYHVLS